MMISISDPTILIEKEDLINLGPVELTQYYIHDTRMFVGAFGDHQQALVVKITLGRSLFGTLMTVFLPTVLLIIISHSTNYFKAFFFESIISVNLTVMLVLTTMFINISNQLPRTSYIKMIDVWLIFSLIVPFVEVLLHTYKESQRKQEEREVNHHGSIRKVIQTTLGKVCLENFIKFHNVLFYRRMHIQSLVVIK